jgi:hypothetical protein
MLSHRTKHTRLRSACNDNGFVSAALDRKGSTLLDILAAAAHVGRGFTLTYVVDGVLIISATAAGPSRGQLPSHRTAEQKAGVRRTA